MDQNNAVRTIPIEKNRRQFVRLAALAAAAGLMATIQWAPGRNRALPVRP